MCGTLLLRIEVSAGALVPNLIITEKEARKEDLPNPRWVPNGGDGGSFERSRSA